jgi:hypothetical protein
MSKAKVWLIESKYNYATKFIKALDEGNIKYIDSLIKRGKVVSVDADAHTDSCGNFSHATIETTIDKL